jgi:antirestriction protein ArdC
MRLYQEVTDKIVRQVESGDVPMWLKPWKVSARNGAGLLPVNTVTGHHCHGIHIPILWGEAVDKGYRSIASVTLMIAREMTREILQRQQRMAAPMEDRHAA